MKIDNFPVAAIARVGCAIKTANGLWRSGSDPDKAKTNFGSSTHLSGERWGIQREEQKIFGGREEQGLKKRSFQMLTRSRSGLFVHSRGYS